MAVKMIGTPVLQLGNGDETIKVKKMLGVQSPSGSLLEIKSDRDKLNRSDKEITKI